MCNAGRWVALSDGFACSGGRVVFAGVVFGGMMCVVWLGIDSGRRVPGVLFRLELRRVAVG